MQREHTAVARRMVDLAPPATETMARERPPAASNSSIGDIVQGETLGQPSSPIAGQTSDCARLASCSSCVVLTIGTCGLYYLAISWTCADCLKWYGVLDSSTPIHCRLADGTLVVKTRRRGCCWHVERFAETNVDHFVVVVEETRWASATVRVTAQHGGGTDQDYELVYGPPEPLYRPADVARVREALARSCSDDDSCDRACAQCLHNLCSSSSMSDRQGFPCVSLAARLKGVDARGRHVVRYAEAPTASSSRAATLVRLSRRRWLARDLRALVGLAEALNAALPEPVVEGTRIPPARVGRAHALGGRVPIVAGDVVETHMGALQPAAG